MLPLITREASNLYDVADLGGGRPSNPTLPSTPSYILGARALMPLQ
jgi:hypothetical protein